MSDPIDIVIGRNIEAARENLKIARSQLASQTGVAEGRLEELEHGAQRAMALELFNLAKTLNLSMADIYAGVS